MHSCLITAPTITEFQSREELMSDAVQAAAAEPQLGILSVAAIFEAAGDRPHILDVNREYIRHARQAGVLHPNAFAEHLADLALRTNADVYGFSSICSTYPLSLRVARSIKQKRPHAITLFGGPQASVVDVATLEAFSFVDLVLRGEVERTLPCLLTELQGDYRLDRVSGLTYREGVTVKRNVSGPVLEDLDDLPAPAYHLHPYLNGARTAAIELGRGCPFSCTFCSTNDFFRRRFRLRSPARVLADMRHIASTYGIQHFELVHDMFTVDRKRVAGFCEAMLASGEAFTWDCSARTDCVDEELLSQMAASGCRGVFFGIETGSARMQRIIDKDLDLERARAMLNVAERLQMKTTASLITGFPEETWPDVQDTLGIFMHAARCSLSRPQLNILAPLAGTPIHTIHKDKMILEDLCSDMSHQGLTQNQEDLQLIQTYPDIFPNFYLIPAASLDRNVLFELRELLSMAVECFRWLLCAVDQVTDTLAFHHQWRHWRIAARGDLIGSHLRRYYLGVGFRTDFLHFIAQHKVSRNPAVFAMLRVEQTFAAAAERDNTPVRTGALIPASAHLMPQDVPCLAPTTRILELPCCLIKARQAIAARSRLKRQPSHFYVTRQDESGPLRLTEISRWMATVIEACDGEQTIAGILDPLSGVLPEVEGEDRLYVLQSLLGGAHRLRLVDIHRGDASAKPGFSRFASPHVPGPVTADSRDTTRNDQAVKASLQACLMTLPSK